MATILCRMCGGTIDVPDEVEDGSCGECPYCGTMITFTIRGGKLIADYPTSPATESTSSDTDGESVATVASFATQDHLRATGQYAELERQLDASLAKAPNHPVLLAQKGIAICLLVINKGTEAIRIAEVASLFAQSLAIIDAAEATGIEDQALSDMYAEARKVLIAQASSSFPIMVKTTMLNKLAQTISDPEELRDGERLSDVVTQITTAFEIFINYPDLADVVTTTEGLLRPLVLKLVNERLIDELLFVYLKKPNSENFILRLLAQLSGIAMLLNFVRFFAKTETEKEIAGQLIKKAHKALLDNNGYNYTQDKWGVYHKVSWLSEDMIASMENLENMM